MTSIGNIDHVSNGLVYGWIWCAHSRQSRPRLSVGSEAIPLLHHPVDRSDVFAGGFGLESGFIAELPTHLATSDDAFTLELRDSHDLDHVVARFTCRPPSVIDTSPSGYVDSLTEDRVVGWLASTHSPGHPILALDDFIVPISKLHQGRADVASAGLAGNSGFIADVPPWIARRITTDDVRVRLYQAIPSLSCVHDAILPRAPRRPPRVAVVAWDLTHNPAGRALVLCSILGRLFEQVDLIGPLHAEFGGRPWPPLAGLKINMITGVVHDFTDLRNFASRLRDRYDLVWICKPRFPAIYLANRVAGESAKVILDIDDDELAFFADVPREPRLELTYGSPEVATNTCGATMTASLALDVPSFPVRTVSNIALQHRHGGTLIRHARDERAFSRPVDAERQAARRAAGIADADFVVMFLGTVQDHKGVPFLVDLARRPELVARRVRLVIIGADDDIRERIGTLDLPNVTCRGTIPFADLPQTLRLADAVVLPQDPHHPFSAFRIPAQISDALASGIDVLISPVASVSDIASCPGVHVTPLSDFEARLVHIIAHRTSPEAIYDSFRQEFSVTAMAGRFESMIASVDQRSWAAARSTLAAVSEWHADRVDRRPVPKALVSAQSESQCDVVILWKQNDLALFNRRVDSIVSALARSSAIGRVVCFEAPMDLRDLDASWSRSDHHADEYALRCMNSLGAVARCRDTERVFYRAFVSSSHPDARLLNARLPTEHSYAEWFEAELRELGVSDRAILWCFPTNYELSDIVDSRKWLGIVGDFVDDQVAFGDNPHNHRRVVENYALTMSLADVVVFSNETTHDRILSSYWPAGLKPSYRACFLHPNAPDPDAIRAALVAEPGPESRRSEARVVGYVGNMRNRIDEELFEAIASECSRRGWQFRIVGGGMSIRLRTRLGAIPGVHMLGPLPFPKAVQETVAFDVAVVPHTVDPLSDSMSPLKVHQYLDCGVPTVSTPVANLPRREGVHVCQSHEDFLSMMSSLAIARPRVPRRHEPSRWDDYVTEVLETIHSGSGR